jgi:hypothetical protein
MDIYIGDFSEFTILEQIEMCREKVTTENGKKNIIVLCEKLVDLLIYNSIGDELCEKLKGEKKTDLSLLFENLKPEPFNLNPFLHYARRNPYHHN